MSRLAAVSMRVTDAVGYRDPRDAIGQDVVRWIESIGHTPVLVPNALRDIELFLGRLAIGAVILTGGNNLVARSEADDNVADELAGLESHERLHGARIA